MEKKLQDTRHEKDEWISTRANILEQRVVDPKNETVV
jgi:hypothetical protein